MARLSKKQLLHYLLSPLVAMRVPGTHVSRVRSSVRCRVSRGRRGALRARAARGARGAAARQRRAAAARRRRRRASAAADGRWLTG